ncbi:RNA polymerase sigma factor [Nocardioides aurantiacus]|uniref:RNA polymerase sigma-70 factor (ECF subfamily) n=1 Tax=Nocardioides aurantiacus TaxID=86796 RepID=A0A3N2CTW7_9ACTN|nr:RNA polymerase sigma factor [Nocardioides aurantiacus]ROR90896.1 RNA polymerase sigma-70 factor (ECF subfamily) [Nocardioides aurantiacus]
MTDHQDLSDAELFAASVATPRLFGAVFDRHAPEILRYLTRRVGPQDAEDLLSQTFLVALEKRASFDQGAETARPWLYGIASNVLLRRQRDEVRFLRALARVSGEPDEANFEEAAAQRVDARSESAALAAGLASLSPGDRNVLLLVVWADLSHQQISRALGIPVGTVKSRTHRARQQLRRHLEPSTRLERTPRHG